MSRSVLLDMQHDALERIKGNALLSRCGGYKVFAFLKGEIESTVALAIANSGTAIFFYPAEPTSSKPNLPGPEFDSCLLRVRIFENPNTNSTGLNAWEVWDEIASERGLHRFRPPSAKNRTFYIADRPWNNDSDPEDATRVFDCLFTFSANLSERQL